MYGNPFEASKHSRQLSGRGRSSLSLVANLDRIIQTCNNASLESRSQPRFFSSDAVRALKMRMHDLGNGLLGTV